MKKLQTFAYKYFNSNITSKNNINWIWGKDGPTEEIDDLSDDD